jgi:hypothetical protein
MGRWARGWQLTKTSWRVVADDRSLIAFPVISAIAALICAAVFFGAGAGFLASHNLEWIGIVVIVIGLYLLIAIGVFCGVALSACAARGLEGQETTVGEGVAAARARLGVIFAGRRAAGRRRADLDRPGAPAGGRRADSRLDRRRTCRPGVDGGDVLRDSRDRARGLGPKDAIKRSSAVLRERWGEGVTGSFAIGGIVFLLGWLPAIALIVLGVAASGSSGALGGVLIGLGVIVLVIAGILQTTIMAVFRVALFRFATENVALGGFGNDELNAAFRAKRR